VLRLEVEKRQPIEAVTKAQVRAAITGLRSYGPSSFASISDKLGNYVQVAGGGVTCMLERHESATGKQYRGFKQDRSKVFQDGTILAFGGGEVKLNSDEWFTASEALEVFISFLDGGEFPKYIKWRDITDMLTGNKHA
jgi:hypothetical protein